MQRDTIYKAGIVGLVLLAIGAAALVHGRMAGRLGSRAPAGAREPGAPAPGSVDAGVVGTGVMDEATVRVLLPHLRGATWIRYDPIAIVRVVPDRQITLPWPEHAGGAMTLRSNNMGFREDEPTRAAAAGPRVLVLGDSHTFGLVENRECFANLLQVRLTAERPGAPCEVINAGVSGTGPYESRALLGLLLAELSPEVVVFVLYAGNDFLNAQAFADAEARRPRLPMPLAAQQRLVTARAAERDRLSQATNQVHSFKYRDGDDDRAFAITLQCLREMQQYCAERGARFLVAVLPTKEDTDLCDLAHMRAVREALLLSDADYAVNARLAARSVAALAEAGVNVVDLLPALSGHDRPMYWKADHHLNVDGHRFVGRALVAPVRALLDPR